MKFPQGLPPSTAGNLAGQFHVPVPPNTPAETVLAVHPTQLYEIGLMLAAFMVLWRLRLRPRPLGWLFGVYLVFAGAERFLVEFLRAKDDRLLAGFTLAQLTSVLACAAGVLLLTRLARAGEVTPGSYLTAGGK